MASRRLSLVGLLLAGGAPIAPAIQCLPPGVPPRAEWRPLITATIPRCEDCQQLWAAVGETVGVHAILIRGLVGVVSVTVGGVAEPTWEDPGVVVPRIPRVRPQPQPTQSCRWQQLGEEK